MTNNSMRSSDLPFLQGGGEMGERMRAMDWSKTALGPAETWPQSLRSTVSMLLPSKAQIIVFWGPQFTVLYNDAYRPVFGAKHPSALGLPGREAWSEIWDSMLHELLAGVVRTGEAFWAKDLLFELERYGFQEETYFDVSYDPVRVESGEVGGVYCIVTETTERVVGERRLALLKDLAATKCDRTHRSRCLPARHRDTRRQAAGYPVRARVPGRGTPMRHAGSGRATAEGAARLGEGASADVGEQRDASLAVSSSASIRDARLMINTALSSTWSPIK